MAAASNIMETQVVYSPSRELTPDSGGTTLLVH